MYLILLGPPGAGKGTQAAIISPQLGLTHVASGDIFRVAIEKGTELGIQAQVYMGKGMLVPDEITIRMIEERITARDCNSGFILDGFPRTLEQAEALDKALTKQGRAIDKVVYINVSKAELQRRLSGRWICRRCQAPYNIQTSPPQMLGRCDRCGGELYQRPDDTMEAVTKRLEVYFTQTIPLIDYYRKAGRLVEVNGKQAADRVAKELVAKLQRK